MTSILVVDDDQDLVDLIVEILEMENFKTQVCHDGESGLAKVDNSIDLILLDIMMPKLNGLDMLAKLREEWQTPVLMLTAKGDEIDKVLAFELGADDYLEKPFGQRELLARIRAILRRTQSSKIESTKKSPEKIVYANLILYPGRLQVFIDDELIKLTSAEFSILLYLLQHLGECVSKDKISKEIFNKRLMPFDRAIDVHISNLRKKLFNLAVPDFLMTIRGRGYMLIEVNE